MNIEVTKGANVEFAVMLLAVARYSCDNCQNDEICPVGQNERTVVPIP